MADQIPNILHFIWVGAKIPTRQAACILSWMHKNPSCVTKLWTNRQGENAQVIADIAKTMPGVFGPAAVSPSHEVTCSRQSDKKAFKLQCVDIVGLKSVTGDALWARFDAEIGARNFGGASDIARLAALFQDGGVYLDTDSDALLELPSLSAKDGILFGVLAKRGFCNAIIAAPKGHKYLRDILQAITSDYEYWEKKGLLAGYRKGVEDARAKVTTANSKHKRLVALKESHMGGLETDIAQVEKDLRTLRSSLQEQMSSGTAAHHRPDPRGAVALHAHGWRANGVVVAKENKIPESAYNTHLKLAQLVAQFQNVVVSPQISQPGVLQKYGFPDGYANINSEASWIK